MVCCVSMLWYTVHHYVMVYCVSLSYGILCHYVMAYCASLYYGILCVTMLSYTVCHYVILYCVSLYYSILCVTMLQYTVCHYVMVQCVSLCYGILCRCRITSSTILETHTYLVVLRFRLQRSTVMFMLIQHSFTKFVTRVMPREHASVCRVCVVQKKLCTVPRHSSVTLYILGKIIRP